MTEIPAPPMPTVDAVMAALVAEADRRGSYRGYGISASQLGTECDRKLWLDLRWASPQEVRTGQQLRILARGREAEARILDDLRRAGLTIHESEEAVGNPQYRFAVAGGLIRGKADGIVTGVVEAPVALHVLEIKCLKAATWRAILRHGLLKVKPEHWHQLHAGMAGLSINRGLYVAENADTGELLTERLHLDPEEASRQEARVLSVAESNEPPLGMRANGSTPKQLEKIAATPPCRFCDHRGICFGGQFALRSCRTCLHWTFDEAGSGECARFGTYLPPHRQSDGAHCPAHRFLPALVPGAQIDADPEAETITYRMPDGSEWIDGGAALEG